ncbi:MAG: hypothetical protein MUE47_09725 [Acidobacteria bacterium]|jgi:Sec-independent protein translocase protein TatA|nr:hypothetical protein [Acidobacteriota bacterium]
MDTSVLWILLAAVVVALLAVLTVYLVQLIVEARHAVREFRASLARLTPELEVTLANARKTSESVARASEALRALPPLANEIEGAMASLRSRTPMAAGLLTAYKVMRWLFKKPRTDAQQRRK